MKWLILPAAALAFSLGAFFASQADETSDAPPAPPLVSTFAPLADLTDQVDYYLKRIDEALASAEFDEAQLARVKKDGHTLAVLLLTLALHDEDNPFKRSASALIVDAQELAKSADQKSAQSARKQFETHRLDPLPNSQPQTWRKVASMGQLMKQVSVIDTALKRNLKGARLKSQAKTTAPQATTLAAIAQATLLDTHEVKDKADLKDWYSYSAEFRDSSAALSAAIRGGDAAKVNTAFARVSKSCETCHQKFHQELK